MRWAWPLLIYVVVVLVHLVSLSIPSMDDALTKALLMPTLLVSVLIIAASTGRLHGRRAWWGAGLLALGIVASFFGDILLGASFVVGLACFAAAHIVYIGLFNAPARARPIAWWSLVYAAALALLVSVLWPHLGDVRFVLVAYGIVLALTAMTSTRVNAIAAWGGGLFLASDALLAFRLFFPDFEIAFPDPWQDLTIMAFYCAGEGLIALGVLARLRRGGANGDRDVPRVR